MAVSENRERFLMLRAFDEALSAEEQALLAGALAKSESLREEQRQVAAMRQLLSGLEAPPAPAFAAGVMGKLQAQRQEARLVSLVVRLAAACLLLFALGLLSLYLQEGTISTDAILGIEGLAPDDAYSLLDD